MATRFYFDRPTVPSISPTVDSSWGASATGFLRRLLTPKLTASVASTLASSAGAFTVGATSLSYAGYQYVGPPMPPQPINGTVSLVAFMSENNATVNATLAASIRVLSQDGGTQRGVLYSVFGTDTELDITDATRIINTQTVTSTTIQGGDRIVVEVGVKLAAGAAGAFAITNGLSAASDYALTSALTTNLNPWIEFSADLEFGLAFNNYATVKVGNGMSGTGGIR